MKGDFIKQKHKNKVEYYQSTLFLQHNIPHMFTIRNTGVSRGCFGSLNMAVGAGDITDTHANVNQNYDLAAEVFGLGKEDICRSHQTHSSRVELVDLSHKGVGISKDPFLQGVDGLVTKDNSLILSVRTADCVPILLADIKSGVISAVHSGWRGTVGRIAKNAVELMVSQGANKENIITAIGPCIGSCCYWVGGEVYDLFLESDPDFAESFVFHNPKGLTLDLVRANKQVLIKAGILPTNIVALEICTKCNPKEFFSHRRSGPNRGTMAAFILKNSVEN